jgi:hypothetical protein
MWMNGDPLAALLDVTWERMRRAGAFEQVLLGACYVAVFAFVLFVAYAEWADFRREARPPLVEVVPGAVEIEAPVNGAPIR